MDNEAQRLFTQHLSTGLDRLGLALSAAAQESLLRYAQELLKWNGKVNLTAITRPEEVAEKHLLDSLCVLPEVEGATHLLDLGAGAGLPGIPLAVALSQLRVTLVDAVAKKVAFIKSGALRAGVAERVKATHVRAMGQPSSEGLPQVDRVIARAFMDLGPFLSLARPYLAPGGLVVAMLGQPPSTATLTALATSAGLTLQSQRSFHLPHSGDPRAVAVFRACST